MIDINGRQRTLEELEKALDMIPQRKETNRSYVTHVFMESIKARDVFTALIFELWEPILKGLYLAKLDDQINQEKKTLVSEAVELLQGLK